MKATFCILVIALVLAFSHSQQVDCIKFINSTYASPSQCFSTSSDTRPINGTAYIKVYKNLSWYGADDWDPYIIRGGYLVRDLYY
jgi:hypothetical protein